MTKHLGNVQATLLEYRTSSKVAGAFATATEVLYKATLITKAVYTPRDVLVTICDEKDNYRFGFNGMEKDNEPKGIANSLDFGARIYDSRIGRFLSTDPEEQNMSWQSPYQFASNSPIFRLDPDGNWDIEIHSFANRGKMSYGIAILKTKDGKEIARYVVRVAGSAGVGKGYSGSDSRTKSNGDTPTGTYDIDDANPWWSNSKDVQDAYGTSSRLAMTGTSGEIMEGSSERQSTIRIHAGRQERNNKKDFDPKNKLKFTNGCVRMYQDDLDLMKSSTINLQKSDKDEAPGSTSIEDDLVESGGRYYLPNDFKNLNKAKNTQSLIKSFTSSMGAFGKIIQAVSDKMVKDAENKGIKPEEHQN